MRNLKLCRINDLDDIFYATKDSQGTNNAILAIKYVLFKDVSVFKNNKPGDNKYLYISSTNQARKKAMLLQEDDLAHILIKYCMTSFGLRGNDFNISNDELVINQKRIDRLEISAYEMIEQVAYMAVGEVYNAYIYLFSNQKILLDVVDYMLNERYIRNLKEVLDSFTGIINNNDMNTEMRYAFYDAFNNLDDSFAEIKRNNVDYIK